jgi:RNA polymerase sigma-70 factor, ECF subfamily
MNSEQERILVAQAHAGDRQALGKLWDIVTPKLFGYLINTLRDKSLAEDVLQSTWLRAIQGLPRFQIRSVPFSAWLFAIARNECRQHWRKSKQELPATNITQQEPSSDNRTELQNRILIDQVLIRLSEDDQELLRLRYIADLSVKDIARVLNSNSLAVRVRLHRAVNRARALLHQQL